MPRITVERREAKRAEIVAAAGRFLPRGSLPDVDT